MQVYRKPVVITLLVFLMLSFVVPERPVRAGGESERLAVTLIIDTSGSMKNTDPDNMRETASRIFMDLLSPEDMLGIITFSDEAVLVQPMTEIGDRKADMKDGVSDKLVNGGNTDYDEAFQKAMDQLDQVKEEVDVRKAVVFITDGNPDPDPARNQEAGFCSAYMEGLWKTLRRMGEKEVPVYTLGIGALDMEVLDRIALETKGKSQRFSDASEIARELFHVIALLKNREVFIEENLDVQDEEVITFTVEKQILQTTFVVIHDREVLTVSLESPDGNEYGGQVHQEVSEKYSLLTLSELPDDAHGDWRLKIKGEGQIEILGARDHKVKVWLDNPITGYGYPVGDPLKITAGISGVNPEKVTMKGTVSYEGKDMGTVDLELKGDKFSGGFEGSVPGEYALTVQALENGEEISRTTSTFLLKNLPVMKPDFSSEGLILGTGQEKVITSTLEIGANTLIQSKDLDLEYFNLVGEINGEKMTFPMLDDGNIALGDLKAGDGRYATRISFDQPGQMELLLQARGLYQGELFIIEKPLGEAAIHSVGGVSVQLKNEVVKAFKGEEITLGLELKSTSPFDEMIHLSIPQELGVLFPPHILLKALESKVVSVRFLPNKDMEFDQFALNLEVELENKETGLNIINSEMKITTVSKLTGVRDLMVKHQRKILTALMSILVIILLYLCVGMLMYHVLRRKRGYLNGKLIITHEESRLSREVDLGAIKKSCLSIILGRTVDKSGKTDEIQLESRYQYGLYIEKQGVHGKSRALTGYGWLFMKGASAQSIRTTEPGIMLTDEQIYLELSLDKEMTFKSGDYFFRYEYNGHKKLKQSREGRNLLEGRV